LPLALDSRPPSDALAETRCNEQRFRRLNAQQPEVAEQLWKDAAADLQKRYDFAQLAGKAEKSPERRLRLFSILQPKKPEHSFGLVVLPINKIIPQNETATINYWHDNKGI
jgi:hypothetical protein